MPSEQELKNEMFKLREILEKKENEVKELKEKIADIEKQLGVGEPDLAAPIPSMPATEMAETKEEEVLAAPMPTSESSRKPKSIQQKVPTSGTSQIHARETQYECPNCGSHYNSEVEDKSRILYVVGAGTRIYGKKHRCMNCGNEWS